MNKLLITALATFGFFGLTNTQEKTFDTFFNTFGAHLLATIKQSSDIDATLKNISSATSSANKEFSTLLSKHTPSKDELTKIMSGIAQFGTLEMLEEIEKLAEFAGIDNMNSSPKPGTPLQLAAMFGNIELVDALLKRGADPDKVSIDLNGKIAYAAPGIKLTPRSGLKVMIQELPNNPAGAPLILIAYARYIDYLHKNKIKAVALDDTMAPWKAIEELFDQAK